MRFLLYDSITSLEPGKSITGVKTFALSDEFLRGHFKKTALIPGVMLIESMAQLLGWLLIHTHQFRLTTAMTLIEDVTVARDLRPGIRADVRGQIVSTSKRDSLGSAQMFVDGRMVGSIGRIIYVHSDKADPQMLRNLFSYYSGMIPEP
jgi:3-hydroxyacyl-[acyl-carrier-protein] dehydratase